MLIEEHDDNQEMISREIFRNVYSMDGVIICKILSSMKFDDNNSWVERKVSVLRSNHASSNLSGFCRQDERLIIFVFGFQGLAVSELMLKTS